MPYYITKNHPDCKGGWATVNGDYELKGCHKTKQDAIDQMVAISQAEDVEPGGTHPRDRKQESILIEADGKFKVPAGVQSAAKRAQQWISEGKAGDGFTATGRRRASQLAAGGSVSRDVVVKMRAYFARHAVDKNATGFSAGEKGYPSPGRVAWDAWGGDAGRTWVNKLKLD